MLNNLKQTILNLRNNWGSNDYDIDMAILQTTIDFCEQHNELGFANVVVEDVYSGDVKLGGLCEGNQYGSEIFIGTDCVEYVEAILNNMEDKNLIHLLTIPVHEYRHAYQNIHCLFRETRYVEAGENMDNYLNHPMEVDAYSYQEKLAEETIQYLIDNLERNYRAEHIFDSKFRTNHVFPKDPRKEEIKEDWEYEMMYDEMYSDYE